MSNVIPLNLPPRNLGNGAREAVQRYFAGPFFDAQLQKIGDATLSQTDHLLAWLYAEGFIVEKLK